LQEIYNEVVKEKKKDRNVGGDDSPKEEVSKEELLEIERFKEESLKGEHVEWERLKKELDSDV